jgi:diaminopimelate epimerase
VRVATRGGTLTITYEGDEHSVSMKGAATKVFDGVWEAPLPQADGAT